MDTRINELLEAYRQGQPGALEQLVPLIYDDLKLLARRHSRQWPNLTLQTTGIVHEAYLKLSGQRVLDASDKGHFLAICSQAMRQLIVDHARKRLTDKRGAGAERVSVEDTLVPVQAEAEQLVLIDQALVRLAEVDARMVRVFECRYFAGLSEEETVDALGIPLRTVQRDWQKARLLLRELLGERAMPAAGVPQAD